MKNTEILSEKLLKLGDAMEALREELHTTVATLPKKPKKVKKNTTVSKYLNKIEQLN